jgi:hypothetical protein
MSTSIQIPLAISEGRKALARMFIELTLAFHATIYPLGEEPDDLDADLALVGVAVMLGHAEGRAMTGSEIEALLHMPHSTTLRRLRILMERGLIKRIGDRYYLEPERAKHVPHRDRFELILSKAFTVLGPILSEMDK